ncbi:hypothetical protein GLP19_18025 [Photobacterium carnosum]|nr:YeeE/YedE family protein [Photobacterium carnosum]MCD9500363.1 hypothetical protein [Photobacterium carnosum]
MLITIAGWIFGWCLFPLYKVNINYVPLPIKDIPIFLVITILITMLIVIFNLPKDRRALLFSIILFGVITSILTLINERWTPSQLIKDITFSFIYKENIKLPNFQRYLIVIAMFIGMVIGNINKNEKIKYNITTIIAVRGFFSGLLMGIGADLTMGGNDVQLFITLPELSPAGVGALLSMILGVISWKAFIAFIAFINKNQ